MSEALPSATLYSATLTPSCWQELQEKYGKAITERGAWLGGIDPYPLTPDECINPLLLLL
jgi:hypothetical protein